MRYAITIAPTHQNCVQFYSLPSQLSWNPDKSFVTPLEFGRKLDNQKKKIRILSDFHPSFHLIDVCQMDSNRYGFGLALLTLPPVRRLVARPAKRADCSTMHPSARHDQPPIKFVAAQFLPGAPSCTVLGQWRHLDTSDIFNSVK